MSQILHFTLGPVQGFVAQARRTRDLWAGSFLLSYLSGCAMKAVIDAGGKIVFPSVQDANGEPTDDLLRAIMGKTHDDPQIGSLPNRFKAEVPEGFDPQVCADAVQEAWKAVADKVWKEYVEDVDQAYGNRTKEIWDDQVKHFWDMNWIVGKDPNDKSDGAWLDKRKNWRTYGFPLVQEGDGGDHCTLMGDWREISGYVGSRSEGKQKQKAFWGALRKKLSKNSLDLVDSERLCAIALIKRLFPLLEDEAKVNTAIGWKLNVRGWHSVSYLAAADWLEEVIGNRDVDEELAKKRREACQTYLDVVLKHRQKLGDYLFGEYHSRLEGFDELGKAQNLHRFVKLDGRFYFEAGLENKHETVLEDEKDRKTLLDALRKLHDIVDKPSPYYALLLMDGDRLGALLQNTTIKEENVSGALGEFTNQVKRIVDEENGGMTIYAGGDDVLALFPLTKVIKAAGELRQAYLEAFKKHGVVGTDTTISGAIIFANTRITLRAVLHEAHRLLDGVAKEQNERDSLAISVLTGSGRSLEWVSSWQDKNWQTPLVTDKLTEAREAFGEKEYANKFFYNIRERYQLLLDENKRLIDGLPACKILSAEYMKSRERDIELKVAEERVSKLLEVSRTRKKGKADDKTLISDGGLLVRFLGKKGLEK